MADRPGRHHRSEHERRSRSRSPRRHHSRSHRTRSPHSSKQRAPAQPAVTLPFNCRELTKRDYEVFKPMFGLYLDIQKKKYLEDLDETEIKGRWKSFIGKWNRGELSEGWYDPSTLQKAVASAAEHKDDVIVDKPEPSKPHQEPTRFKEAVADEDSDSDDSVGPALPGQEPRSRRNMLGPSIPNMEDLELKREMDAEDGLARRDDIRFARKLDRRDQKEKLDELVPRAEAGTRERQLEKKKEVNEKMKSFRERSPGAVEVPDTELMGGGDGIDSYKKEKKEFERKKNERELRKEEILRARQAEREERLQEYRQKEDSTMAMLKALAKQKFG
ncbi:hypothetical protein BP6252_09799 [Coleophoma cylindrospora]|uniref:RNA helicase HEL117 n=1 Tax=Coleophoma cylindrospora TaxID=1849047 RepID=A0A3D8QX97_9HELO|nr:hypothetical protein BP6252_09799 [Coleophoma cylindrospora]